ncbi:SLC13 family permease [Pontibacter sp. SGAir0037]|uniref:SLC13 family permease n=1 Tax=Pontibacter sp. SGAir0037 TaxID=2571030 RepID=UPI0010CD2855|nr:SLC13 family permease [Pontibacter sp. SGAir0037]QCR24009.1 SLC13 family permease [Pontibacter sp. SGAir0037]
MTFEIGLVLIIIAVAIVLFISERLPIDTVAIIVMALFLVTGILTPAEGLAGFSNPATITVGAMFIVSASIFKSGALSSVGTLLTRIGRKNYLLCLLAVMLVSGGLSAFINDTAVVALLMPVLIQVCRDTKISPAKLLMPLSFGSLMGGVCTLIGTSTNILVSGIAEAQGVEPLRMFDFTPAGIFFLAAGILYMFFIGRHLLPNRKHTQDLTEDFGMGDYLTEIILLPDSPSVGMPLQSSGLIQNLDIDVLQITRDKKFKLKATPYTMLRANDILKVRCDVEKLKKLKEEKGIELKSERKFQDKDLRGNNTKLYEAIVTPSSYMQGKSLKELDFRTYNHGATVLAIRHRDEILHEKLTHVKLSSGDVLLISADKEQAEKLRYNEDILLISERERSAYDYTKIIPVMIISAGIVMSAAIGLAPIVISSLVGVLLLVLFRCIEVTEVYKFIDWKVIFMLAGVLSMGAALEKTGAASLLSGLLIDVIGEYGPRVLLSVFFFITFVFTNFMSNNATAALLAPIAIVAAKDLGLSPKPFLMAVTYAASLSFMTPMGYQTNTMIYGPGNYRFSDYLKVGTPLNLLLWLLASIILPWFFPFE